MTRETWRRYTEAYERMMWQDWETWRQSRRFVARSSDEALRLACWLEDDPIWGT